MSSNGLNKKARVIAFYLPQFHPIPENDEWWGKGFTEWMNVGKAKPLFPGHLQPRVPSELGYYDLRVPETREAQANLAREYGIEGFAYWHYWFGNGRQLLERPFNEVLESGKPDFPFCLSWANETWKGFWHGLKDRQTLIAQEYPGIDDYVQHFKSVLPAFKDSRYLTVDNKPIFIVYHPFSIPNSQEFIELWQRLAKENGLPGIFFVGIVFNDFEIDTVKQAGYDAAIISTNFRYTEFKRPFIQTVKARFFKWFFGVKQFVCYSEASKHFVTEGSRREDVFPLIIPNWDHTPRTKKEGIVFHKSTPALFKKHLQDVKDHIKDKDYEHNIAVIKSWNEWGEGNFMEPDIIYGRQYLEVFRDVFGE